MRPIYQYVRQITRELSEKGQPIPQEQVLRNVAQWRQRQARINQRKVDAERAAAPFNRIRGL